MSNPRLRMLHRSRRLPPLRSKRFTVVGFCLCAYRRIRGESSEAPAESSGEAAAADESPKEEAVRVNLYAVQFESYNYIEGREKG